MIEGRHGEWQVYINEDERKKCKKLDGHFESKAAAMKVIDEMKTNKVKLESLGIEIEEDLSIDQLESVLKKFFVSDNDVFIWRNKATEKFTVVTPWVKFNEKYFQDIIGLDHAAPDELGISREAYIKSAMKNVRNV